MKPPFAQDLFSVAGKTVLLTGGTAGIGRMIAEGMIAAGAHLMIVARSASDCAEFESALGGPPSCRGLVGDLSTYEGVLAVTAEVAQLIPKLDVLIHCAGKFQVQPIDDVSEADWDYMHSLNMKAAFFLAQQLHPLLRAASTPEDPARIINIASGHGMRVAAFETYQYQSSKAGLIHLTRGLAARFARDPITVNAIAPGVFPSRGTSGFTTEQMAAIASGVPMGRVGAPSDAAGAAIFLSSRASTYITGVVLPVDGGWVHCK